MDCILARVSNDTLRLHQIQLPWASRTVANSHDQNDLAFYSVEYQAWPDDHAFSTIAGDRKPLCGLVARRGLGGELATRRRAKEARCFIEDIPGLPDLCVF